MRTSWSRGFTKQTHHSVRKISETMKARKIDNFSVWREQARKSGSIRNTRLPLEKSGDLAELIGVVLGDGHICKHVRCESLRITGNFSNTGFTSRYAALVERVFHKNPTVAKVKGSNATILTIYEKNISHRLSIPTGARATLEYKLPTWIKRKREYRIRFLRGLYEAEGSECHHLKTSTHKLFFSNRNPSLLTLVSTLVQDLGFKTNMSQYNVQVSRQKEVQNLCNLLEFRHYDL